MQILLSGRRLSLMVIFWSFLGIAAYAQESRITIKQSNTPLSRVLNEIESKSGYSFLVRSSDFDLNQVVSIHAENKTIGEILSMLFRDKDVKYEINDKSISIYKPQQAVPPKGLEITGSVEDINGEAIIGANILEKGTNNVTVTDVDGRFSLKVKGNSRLIVSYLGYIPKEVAVNNNSGLSIVLSEDEISLNEIVVVGYGTMKRRDLTGSVSSVGQDVLKNSPVTSVAQTLAGRMPGVQITQTDGSQEAEMKIRIRGGGSLTQDNSPLYVVDGFPVEDINNIVPGDIESVDVLKDASSTAIYGARGANGVILITTKGGVESKPKINFNSYYGVKKMTDFYDVMDGYEYVNWQWEYQMLTNQNNYNSLRRSFGEFQDMHLYRQMKGEDWVDQILGKTGTVFNNNLSVNGGNKMVRYNVSLTHNNNKEIMMGQSAERLNLSGKTLFNLTDRLSLDVSVRVADYSFKGAGTGSARLNNIVQYRPVDGITGFVDPTDGFDIDNEFVLNPYLQTQDDYRRREQLTLNVDAAVNYKITKELTFRIEAGQQYAKNTYKRFYGLNTFESILWGAQPLAYNEKRDGESFRVANTFTYSKSDFIKDHTLTLMIGQEYLESKNEIIYAESRYFPKYIDAVSALSMMQLGVAQPVKTSDSQTKTASFFGRANYDYKGKYLLSATLRTDGSSKFARGNRWASFPSLGVGWRISDEGFMAPASPWLSHLKPRLSFGQAGNDRIGNNLSDRIFEISAESMLYMEGNEENPTVFIVPGSVLSNPGLKWERTITQNVGLDFGFFDNRLSGSFELYHNKTKDLLIKSTIPSSSGYSQQMQNIGQTSNKGLELALSGVIIKKQDFSLSANFNIAFNKNRIDKLGETKEWLQSTTWTADSGGPNGEFIIKEGGQVGTMYGYVTDGMYTYDDFDYVNGKYVLNPDVPSNQKITNPRFFGPGSLKFKNQNDDLVIDEEDKVVIGNANPKHTGGFGINATLKGFDLSAFFNWVYGNDIYNANKMEYTSTRAGRTYKNLINMMNSENRFTYLDPTTGYIATDPERLKEMNQHATMWSPGMSLVPLHSWAVEDGSFLRLNTLTLGYTLPTNLLKKARIDNLRVYVTGYNLWTWTNYSGNDPEVDTQRTTPLTPGVDYNAYPKSRSFIVGLNLTL